MRYFAVLVMGALLAAQPVVGQMGAPGERVPAGMTGLPGPLTAKYQADADKILTAAMADNDGYAALTYLCDHIGKRLSGSPQLNTAVEWGAELMDEHFDPVVLRLIDLLKRAVPGSSKEDIFWSYHFVTGALMLTLARTGRIDKLSGGACRSEDFAAVKQRMSSFMAGGFLAVYRQRAKNSKR